MLNKLIFIGLVTFLTLSFEVKAQDVKEIEKVEKKPLLEKFSITPQIGLLHSWGDFNSEEIRGLLNQNKLGVSLLLNYRLNKVITLSTGFLSGKLVGTNDKINTTGAQNEPSDLGLGILFRTNLFEVTLPRVDVNLTRLIFMDKSNLFNRLSIGLIASHGLVYSDSRIYSQQDESVYLIYRNENKDKRGSSGKTVEAVTSYGIGFSYIINDKFNIGVESTIRNVWNDRLDAWETTGSSNDKYSFTAFSLTYHLKKRKDVVKYTMADPSIIEDSEMKGEKSKVDATEETKKVIETIEEKREEIVEEVNEEKFAIIEKKEEQKEKIAEKANNEKNVVAEKKDEFTIKQEKPLKRTKVVTDINGNELEIYMGRGNFISVAAFRGVEGAGRMARVLKSKGENPIILKNKKKTWYIVAIDKYDNKNDALVKMKEARDRGYKGAWVHIK